MQKLLEAKREDETPGLYFALKHGHGEAVTAFMNAVIEIPELTPEQIETIFLAKDEEGDSGLSFAQNESGIAFGEACGKALKENKIDIKQFDRILSDQ